MRLLEGPIFPELWGAKMDEPWTAETVRKVRERAEMCRAEAELASEPRKTELLETALAYERMIERAKRHFELKDGYS